MVNMMTMEITTRYLMDFHVDLMIVHLLTQIFQMMDTVQMKMHLYSQYLRAYKIYETCKCNNQTF